MLDMEAIKVQKLKQMRNEVKWYTSRRSTNPNVHQFYKTGNKEPGPRSLEVKQACLKVWEKFGQDWRSKVILRDSGATSNIPDGH